MTASERRPAPAAACRFPAAGRIRGWTALAALLLCSGTGCVQRRLMIVSQPPGALVYVGNQEVGTTPVAVNFTYYGTRQIRLVKDGYETLTERIYVPPPWYQYPVADFVSENMVPWTISDRRTLDFALTPTVVPSLESIVDRAQELRGTTRGGQPPPPASAAVPRTVLPR